jgi:hypothetical protein
MNARVFEDLLETAQVQTSTSTETTSKIDCIVVGQIVGFKDNGATPLVICPKQPGTAAIAARAIVDLHGEHIGQDVVLMFEDGDLKRPIVMGYVRGEKNWRLPERPGQVEVDADGERLVVTAKERIILRCGKASITLTKAGKVLIEGSYVLSRSAGVNRIKGGSVQLN